MVQLMPDFHLVEFQDVRIDGLSHGEPRERTRPRCERVGKGWKEINPPTKPCKPIPLRGNMASIKTF